MTENSKDVWYPNEASEWNVVSIKSLFSFKKGLSITKADLQEEGAPTISYGQIHAKYNTGVHVTEDLIRYVNTDYYETNSQSLAYKNDFLFADTSEDLDGCGNNVLIDTENPVLGGYHTIVLSSKDNESHKYLAYLFKTDAWRSQIRKQLTEVKLYSISQKCLKQTKILLPPDVIQAQIVAYLDDKCSKIDEAITKHRTLIEKLKEYRKAVITKAVTKGLDPDVEMKDSNQLWIGEIPEHWRVIRNKFLLIGSYSGGTPKASNPLFYSDEGLPFISIADMSTVDYVYTTEKCVTEAGIDDKNLKVVPSGSVIYSMYATVGKVAETKIDATISQAIIALYIKNSFDKNYYKYNLQALKEYILSSADGTTQMNLNAQKVYEMYIVEPPLNEQQLIASYLDEKCAKIDEAIARHESLITKLEEYKKSIIYNAVTGKIDCRKDAE